MFRTLKILLTSALVKGLVGQYAAWALGYGFIALLRAMRGLPTPWLYEPAVAFGAIISVIGFLVGYGVLTDWLKWIVGKRTPLRHGAPEGKPDLLFAVGDERGRRIRLPPSVPASSATCSMSTLRSPIWAGTSTSRCWECACSM